jgi:hypothetical protein
VLPLAVRFFLPYIQLIVAFALRSSPVDSLKFLASIFFNLSILAAPLGATQLATPLSAESVAYRRSQLASPDLRPADKLADYARYDFSALWTESNKRGGPYGFIGPNYQRLRIRILTVKRDAKNSKCYHLAGKTQVNGYVAAFSGILVLQYLRELRHLAVRVDETVSPAQREGVVLATYTLREDVTQRKSGIFTGIAKMNWYLDKQGRLRYDDIYGQRDGYCNNQFVGTWTSYVTKKTLRCNWGDLRIPNSGSFDIGAGEFSPDPKYYSYGWQNFKDIFSGSAAAGWQRENEVWWK